jgi:Xaa-Pro aminopeptidase
MNYADRVRHLMEDLEQPLLVSSLVNIRYLTGFTGSNAFIYATPDGCTFLTDGRYGEIAGALIAELPATGLSVYKSGLYDRLVEMFGTAPTVGLESAHTTWETQRAIESRFSGHLEPTAGIVEKYRIRKDADEIDALRSAASAGDHAFSEIESLIAGAETEAELGELMITSMGEVGGERAGWPPIVAFGPNASRPHHESGSGDVRPGLLLLDYGCVVEGYHSDMTRTIWRGEGSDAETERVYAAVLESNEAGIAVVKPGIPAGDVDAASREVLVGYGYEQYFVHSTGHGVGLEIHEGPSVRQGGDEILEPGQVITVEPGVYLPGRLGVRIEDMVLVTEDGGEVLTRSSKEMRPT